jgi:hypothetical protein
MVASIFLPVFVFFLITNANCVIFTRQTANILSHGLPAQVPIWYYTNPPLTTPAIRTDTKRAPPVGQTSNQPSSEIHSAPRSRNAMTLNQAFQESCDL